MYLWKEITIRTKKKYKNTFEVLLFKTSKFVDLKLSENDTKPQNFRLGWRCSDALPVNSKESSDQSNVSM